METVIISNVAGMCSHCGEWRNPVKSTVRWVRFWMGLFFGGFFFFLWDLFHPSLAALAAAKIFFCFFVFWVFSSPSKKDF